MVVTRCRRLPFLLLPALLIHPCAATAASSLAEAVKQADAKYLDVPDIGGTDKTPKIEAGGGEEDRTPAAQEISQAAVKASLTYREAKSEDGEIMRSPVVTVSADGKEVAKLEGDSGGFADPLVSVQIAEIDPGNSAPEVVVSFYTGGAHCCSDTSVVTSNAEGSTWTSVEAGDGRYEFAVRDNAFLYAFACYACSEAPLEVFTVENGAIKIVTSEARFRPAQESWLKSMIGNVPEDDVNGFLAGYVGEKIVLGEGKQAWELMLAHYDQASDWGLETCEQSLDADGECPGGEVKLSFPDALQRMLNENGYTIEE